MPVSCTFKHLSPAQNPSEVFIAHQNLMRNCFSVWGQGNEGGSRGETNSFSDRKAIERLKMYSFGCRPPEIKSQLLLINLITLGKLYHFSTFQFPNL